MITVSSSLNAEFFDNSQQRCFLIDDGRASHITASGFQQRINISMICCHDACASVYTLARAFKNMKNRSAV